MSDFNITNEKEARIYLLGIMQGLNKTRLSVWGFGYDNDDTALMIRRKTSDDILKIKEMLDIESFGDDMFGSVREYVNKNNS